MNYRLKVFVLLLICYSCNTHVNNKQPQSKDTVAITNSLPSQTAKSISDTLKKDSIYKINKKDSHSRKQGKWITYGLRHHIWREYNYVNDTLNGISKIYYDNGAVEFESYYTMGIEDSQKLFREKGGIYNEDGSLKSFVKMKDGKMAWYCEYDPNGRKSYEEFYKNDKFVKSFMYFSNGGVSVGYPTDSILKARGKN